MSLPNLRYLRFSPGRMSIVVLLVIGDGWLLIGDRCSSFQLSSSRPALLPSWPDNSELEMVKLIPNVNCFVTARGFQMRRIRLPDSFLHLLCHRHRQLTWLSLSSLPCFLPLPNCFHCLAPSCQVWVCILRFWERKLETFGFAHLCQGNFIKGGALLLSEDTFLPQRISFHLPSAKCKWTLTCETFDSDLGLSLIIVDLAHRKFPLESFHPESTFY